MKRIFWIILALLLVALLTSPNEGLHKKKINQEFKGENPVTGVLGAGKVFSELVSYHDYYVFSSTTFRDETVSFGIFRMVFVFKDLDLIETEGEN
jgi:hypothetical protein